MINTHKMKLKRLRSLFKELSEIDDCDILKEKLKIYASGASQYPIKKIIRPNLIEFYPIVGKNENYREIPGEKIGKLSIKLYNENKKDIEILRVLGLIEELKTLIKKLNKEV